MARKSQLREQRSGMVINVTSKQQEKDIIRALLAVINYLKDKFGDGLRLHHDSRWYLKDIVAELRSVYDDVEFHYQFDKSYMQPDGGMLYLHRRGSDFVYPILISEVKNQGTNDARQREGLPRQAKGNAIERLGKNVIGLRTALMRESIFPFVCFGYGCDFANNSSILDRVITMAMFGDLNRTCLHNEPHGFNRGSFYFREVQWSIEEMLCIMTDIAERSILYYFSKYGQECFVDDYA